ncbi:MAG: DUF721 domain-containing protein [Actinobacteria bacterium]|nr:DUF721 domain-containing protein [Actinomycetota bacterium]
MGEGAEKIDFILKELISGLNIERKIRQAKLFNHWCEIVGENISKKTEPRKLVNGVLYIQVVNSMWANELSLMCPKLIEKINSFVGEDVVKQIKFRVG